MTVLNPTDNWSSLSVSAGQESNVIALLAAGVDVNATNSKGQTAL
jgi:hypothetical protein